MRGIRSHIDSLLDEHKDELANMRLALAHSLGRYQVISSFLLFLFTFIYHCLSCTVLYFSVIVMKIYLIFFWLFKVKFNPDKIDTMIIQGISLLDDLDKELNNYIMRLIWIILSYYFLFHRFKHCSIFFTTFKFNRFIS